MFRVSWSRSIDPSYTGIVLYVLRSHFILVLFLVNVCPGTLLFFFIALVKEFLNIVSVFLQRGFFFQT